VIVLLHKLAAMTSIGRFLLTGAGLTAVVSQFQHGGVIVPSLLNEE
jgi:hypothetical protein